MKLKKMFMFVALLVGVGIGLGMMQSPVSASASRAIPRAYRGHWYGNHTTFIVKKHSVYSNYNGTKSTLKGKRLYVSNGKNGCAWGVSGTDAILSNKRVKRTIHGKRQAVLINFADDYKPAAPYSVRYFTRHKSDRNKKLMGHVNYRF